MRHGRAGLATSFARADFDDVHVAATNPMSLLTKNYAAFGSIRGREFTEIGGNWEILLDEEGNHQALAQLNANGNALAVIGIPVANQQITSVARIGSFNSSKRVPVRVAGALRGFAQLLLRRRPQQQPRADPENR